MPFEIKKPFVPAKTFIINRNLHLNKEDKWVEETDVTGVRNLGSKGKAFYEEEAKSYGLDESHRLVEEAAPEPVPEAATPEPAVEAVAEPMPDLVEPEALKGKLPEDFPGHAALADAGINTYGQLAKVEDVTTIPGIGEATAAKIAEALQSK